MGLITLRRSHRCLKKPPICGSCSWWTCETTGFFHIYLRSNPRVINWVYQPHYCSSCSTTPRRVDTKNRTRKTGRTESIRGTGTWLNHGWFKIKLIPDSACYVGPATREQRATTIATSPLAIVKSLNHLEAHDLKHIYIYIHILSVCIYTYMYWYMYN